MLPGPVSTALLTSRSMPSHWATTVETAPTQGVVIVQIGGHLDDVGPGPADQVGRLFEAARESPPAAGVGVVSAFARPSGAAGDGDVPPGAGQCDCGGLADAAGGAGDKGALPGRDLAASHGV